jgi:hypothetical protein
VRNYHYKNVFIQWDIFHLAFISLLVLFLPITTPAQEIKAAPRYEPENPTTLSHPDMDRWSYLPNKLQVSVGSIDIRYDRDYVPMFDTVPVWKGSAWKGERINLQIVLWTNRATRQVWVVPSELINDNNRVINPSNIQARFVRYVLSDDHFYGCKPNTQQKAPILVADILDNLDSFDIPANTTRPVWVTIDIPLDASPGMYRGNIAIKAKGEKDTSLKIALEVFPLEVPPARAWKFELDLWQNPWAVARYHDVEPWSEEHLMLLKPLLKMLANAGQKYITTSIIHHPWNAQTYDPYRTMIKWIKTSDGSWKYDYSIFDKWVELCMECGIDKYISCYSMISFRNNNFRYYDAATGIYEYVYAEPGTPEYVKHWQPFLNDFTDHLEGKGWLEKTSIAMDERPYELMKEIMALIHNASPKLKINLASEDWQEQLHHEIFSYSVSLGRYTQPEIIKKRTEKGLVSTFYPCCVEPQPNNYPHSDPAESTWMGWLAAADEFSGFLRWAYNSWVEQPLYDTRYSQWNAGECFLIYPGARSSIRFERLREGIQDYEKIRIVKNKLQELEGTEANKKLTELKEILDKYSYKNAQTESCTSLVNESKQILNNISRYLSSK